MATILIRKLDEKTKKRLRVRAAAHGRSMEEEARSILKSALGKPEQTEELNLYDAIRLRIGPLGGVTLPEIPREPMREPPDFAE